MILEEQADIFCIFHDGSFSEFIRNKKNINFTVDIKYLSRLVNPIFSSFKGQMINCSKLEYHLHREEDVIITDLKTLSELYLEISYAQVINGCVAVICYSHDNNLGGNLVFVAENIVIFDEAGQVIEIDELNEICKLYWNKPKLNENKRR